jgi:hypothetical protein
MLTKKQFVFFVENYVDILLDDMDVDDLVEYARKTMIGDLINNSEDDVYNQVVDMYGEQIASDQYWVATHASL